MKKMNIYLLILLIGLISATSYAKPQYNKDHLKAFEETNECVACDLSSANLTPNHSGAILNYANLSGIEAENMNFSDAKLSYANLSGAILVAANFSGADLTGASFAGAYLSYANFYGAKGADFQNADVCMAIMPDGTRGIC